MKHRGFIRLAAGVLGLSLSLGGLPVFAGNAQLRPEVFGFSSVDDMITKTGIQHLYYTDENGTTIPYWIYIPKNEDGSVDADLPLVVHMHGHTDGGDNNTVLDRHYGLGYRLLQDRENAEHKSIILIPQTPMVITDDMEGDSLDRWVNFPFYNQSQISSNWSRHNWSMTENERSSNMKAAHELILKVQSEYQTDPDRTYLSGQSMGGCATWDFLLRDDEHLFAAAMPTCGIGDPSLAYNAIDVPIHIYHCSGDPTVPVGSSDLMYQALRAGGNVTYKRYEESSHFAWNYGWSQTMDDDNDGICNIDDEIDWLFNQSRKGPIDGQTDIGPLTQLVSIAQSATSVDYSAEVLADLDEAVAKANTLLEEQNPDDAACKEMCRTISRLISKKSGNLALNQTVLDTQTYNTGFPRFAVDGNLNTFWDGDSTQSECGSKLTVLLDHPSVLDSLQVITYHPASSRFYHYVVEGSLDGTNWVQLGEKSDDAVSTSTGQTYELDGSRLVSQIRITGTYGSPVNSFHLSELIVNGTHEYLDLEDRAEKIEAIFDDENRPLYSSELLGRMESYIEEAAALSADPNTSRTRIEESIVKADALLADIESAPDLNLLQTACTKASSLDLAEFADTQPRESFSEQLATSLEELAHPISQQSVNEAARSLNLKLLDLRKVADAQSLPAIDADK